MHWTSRQPTDEPPVQGRRRSELDNGILATYRPTKVEEKGGYTVINHPNLLASGIRDVFEAFRKEVLALDPCVTDRVPKAVCGLQGGDEFRRCRVASQAAAPDI
jgi:hypothetical protein